jgi:hypothetical protein
MNTVAPIPLEDQVNQYNDRIAQHLKEIPGKMFTFEVTKCCNYSTLVFLYKEDMISHLFTQVAKHFGLKKMVSLYMLDQEGEKVQIPFNIYMSLKEFIFENTNNQRILKPIYDVPLPVVYRIYLDDGHHHDHVH